MVEALNAGIPMIVLAGDTNRSHAWKNMTQECRQVDILTPAAKELIRIEDGLRIPEQVRRAFAVATSGRPGPVVLDVPEDICHGEYDFTADDFWVDPAHRAIPGQRSRPAADDIGRAAALLGKAQRPLILAGGGVHLSQAHEALQDLAEALNIPVAHTMSGKGGIACTHPLSAGLYGRYSRIANDLIDTSDCLLVVGGKLGEIPTKRYALLPPDVPLIHLDILEDEIGRTTRTEVPLWGDAREGLRDLLTELSDSADTQRAARQDYAAEVPVRMAKWKDEAADRLHSSERPINMARMLTELNTVMPPESVLVADGGFAGHWTGFLYDTKLAGRTYIADRGLASIGYGLPGAIGAQLGVPGSPGGRHHRRRRLQHGDRRAGNRAAARGGLHDHGGQQRRLRLREGAAALDVRWQVPVERAGRDELREHRQRLRLPGHPGRGSGCARRCDPDRHGGDQPPDRRGRRRHPRPGEDAAGGRQPRAQGGEGRPAGVMTQVRLSYYR